MSKIDNIFKTVDWIKRDVSNCGRGFRPLKKHFPISTFEHSESSFKAISVIRIYKTNKPVKSGENGIGVNGFGYLLPGRRVLIYNLKDGIYEFNEIKEVKNVNDGYLLSEPLKNDYPTGSNLATIREVQYRFFDDEKVLKRKFDWGDFVPMLENVDDFFIKYFPESESVLYQIEGEGDSVRGYVYLTHN